jgi:hypothetical protein
MSNFDSVEFDFDFFVSNKVTQLTPATAVVQFGEPDEDEIIWDDTEEVELWLSDGINLDGEAGLDVNVGGWGYAGYNPKTKNYWRYSDEAIPESGEHCMRIVQITKIKAGICPVDDLEKIASRLDCSKENNPTTNERPRNAEFFRM